MTNNNGTNLAGLTNNNETNLAGLTNNNETNLAGLTSTYRTNLPGLIFYIPMKKTALAFIFFLICSLSSQVVAESIHFTISMEDPANHTFKITLDYRDFKIKDTVEFKMPVWTPGYYQRLDFAKQVKNFTAIAAGSLKKLNVHASGNAWEVATLGATNLQIMYEVVTTRSFVATPYLSEERAYIIPAGICMHPANKINLASIVELVTVNNWSVTTGLDKVPGKDHTYTATDFDILYDCPILVGPLDSLPSFHVKGIPHYFKGIKLGDFDRKKLIDDLQKIVETSTNLIGHIPYKHYTFIAIGPGAGGIEHLNNTTFSFNGNNLHDRSAYLRMLFFLTHEYFHHYNVKRIRPIELGPFDYDQGNRTNSLWVSEGISVYYEYLIVRRAGLCTNEELLDALRKNISAFENKTGKKYQTLAQASWETWNDGPFGRVNDVINKTISYYDKGPAVAMLFDFKIRQLTSNKKSLDDVMRLLYYQYYLKKNRGFTEVELKQAFEKIAGGKLNALMDYVYTTQEIDYDTYLNYAGLQTDDSLRSLPGAWVGMSTRKRQDTIQVSSVEYESPAWNAGLRQGMVLVSMNNLPPVLIEEMVKQVSPGDKTSLEILSENKLNTVILEWGQRKLKSYALSPIANLTKRQQVIYYSWITGKPARFDKK